MTGPRWTRSGRARGRTCRSSGLQTLRRVSDAVAGQGRLLRSRCREPEGSGCSSRRRRRSASATRRTTAQLRSGGMSGSTSLVPGVPCRNSRLTALSQDAPSVKTLPKPLLSLDCTQRCTPRYRLVLTLPRCSQQLQVSRCPFACSQALDLVPEVNRYESVSVSPPVVVPLFLCLSPRRIVGFRFLLLSFSAFAAEAPPLR